MHKRFKETGPIDPLQAIEMKIAGDTAIPEACHSPVVSYKSDYHQRKLYGSMDSCEMKNLKNQRRNYFGIR